MTDLWFTLPPGFTEVDLREDPGQRMLRIAGALEPMLPGATSDQILATVVTAHHGLTQVVDNGAVHLSHGLFRRDGEDDEDGQDGEISLTQGMFTVFIHDGPFDDPRERTRISAAQWKAADPATQTHLTDLPYGPVALAVNDQTTGMPGAAYGVTGEVITHVRQFRAALPLRGGRQTALFVFTTEDTDQWEHYLEMMAAVMKSVRPTEDSESASAPQKTPSSRILDLM